MSRLCLRISQYYRTSFTSEMGVGGAVHTSTPPELMLSQTMFVVPGRPIAVGTLVFCRLGLRLRNNNLKCCKFGLQCLDIMERCLREVYLFLYCVSRCSEPTGSGRFSGIAHIMTSILKLRIPHNSALASFGPHNSTRNVPINTRCNFSARVIVASN
jgi:hypothetical protein